MKRFLFAAVASLALLAAASGGPSSAQTTEEYQIAVALSSTSLPVFSPGVSNLGAALKTLTAKVGDTTCTTVSIANATSDVILHIGASGQPAACSVEGATVRLVDGDGHWLFMTFTLRKGTRDTLINLVPLPPGSPQGRKPNLLGPMRVVIPASIMAEPVSGGPDEDTIGEFLGGTVSVYADRVFCGSVAVANISEDMELLVGLDSQDPSCSRQGATLTFTAASGALQRPIGPAWQVDLGTRRVLTSFGGAAIGDYFYVPPPDARRDVPSGITPPAAGDGGLIP